VEEPGKNEYYLDECVFDGDPIRTRANRSRPGNRCGSGFVQVTKNPEGVWVGRRDIVLGRNVPDYR
jgi:protocatechuate 3,4-dioxygenase beta subunit